MPDYNKTLSEEELFDAIDGIFAYDTGCVGSGIRDEQLRAQVQRQIESMNEDEFRLTMSRYVRSYYLSDEALQQGYGVEDVKSFFDWLSDYMDYDL